MSKRLDTLLPSFDYLQTCVKMLNKTYYIIIISASILFITYLHYLTNMNVYELHNLPHIIMSGDNTFLSTINKLLYILFLGLFAFLAGTFVDHEKRHREKSEKDRYLAGLGQATAAIVHDLKKSPYNNFRLCKTHL